MYKNKNLFKLIKYIKILLNTKHKKVNEMGKIAFQNAMKFWYFSAIQHHEILKITYLLLHLDEHFVVYPQQ